MYWTVPVAVNSIIQDFSYQWITDIAITMTHNDYSYR